jgi:DNA-binding transcriptional regulator YiaG
MKKDTNSVDVIEEGLKEAIRFAQGKETEGRVTYFFADQQICPREIREKMLGLTRKEFCEWFLVKVHNQRNWETNKRPPDDITLAFYAMIMKKPKFVYQVLHGKPMPTMH